MNESKINKLQIIINEYKKEIKYDEQNNEINKFNKKLIEKDKKINEINIKYKDLSADNNEQ